MRLRAVFFAVLFGLPAVSFAADPEGVSPLFEVGKPSVEAFVTWGTGYGAVAPDGRHVAAYVSFSDSRLIHAGSRAELRIETSSGAAAGFQSSVSDVLRNADPRTGQAIVTIPIPSGEFTPRSYVSVKIELKSRSALAVPTTAVVRVGGKPFVVRRKGKDDFEQVPVTVGRQNPKYTEILGGLKADDPILIRGAVEWVSRLTVGEED